MSTPQEMPLSTNDQDDEDIPPLVDMAEGVVPNTTVVQQPSLQSAIENNLLQAISSELGIPRSLMDPVVRTQRQWPSGSQTFPREITDRFYLHHFDFDPSSVSVMVHDASNALASGRDEDDEELPEIEADLPDPSVRDEDDEELPEIEDPSGGTDRKDAQSIITMAIVESIQFATTLAAVHQFRNQLATVSASPPKNVSVPTETECKFEDCSLEDERCKTVR